MFSKQKRGLGSSIPIPLSRNKRSYDPKVNGRFPAGRAKKAAVAGSKGYIRFL
jgi:hypothetical protein